MTLHKAQDKIHIPSSSLLVPLNPDWRQIEIFAIPPAHHAFYSFVTLHTPFPLLRISSLFFIVWVYIFLLNRHNVHASIKTEILQVFHLPRSVEYLSSAPLIHSFKKHVLNLYYLYLSSLSITMARSWVIGK